MIKEAIYNMIKMQGENKKIDNNKKPQQKR